MIHGPLEMHDKVDALLKKLFPLHRSLTGNGNRETLKILKSLVPSLTINEVPSGLPAYDWEIPREWSIKNAYIREKGGRYICSLDSSNLHVVAYSVAVNKTLCKTELIKHLHWLEDQPDAIPYVTSYYREYWGFCVTKSIVSTLREVEYEVFIESSHFAGSMSFGEIFLPGKSKREVVFSTYICHPSLANNELSGPILSICLAEILSRKSNYYSYRFLFLPETIGSIYYISKSLDKLKKYAMAIFVITCVGDDGGPSYLSSRTGNTYADRLILELERRYELDLKKFSWLERGSDERQYGSPGVDLPVASLMRSKYGQYPEYHTSYDNLSLVKAKNILESLHLYEKLIEINEQSRFYVNKHNCEPMLSKRNLYPTISDLSTQSSVADMLNVLSFADGRYSDIDIANAINLSLESTQKYLEKLELHQLVKAVSLDAFN